MQACAFSVPIFLLTWYVLLVVVRHSFTLGEASVVAQMNVLLCYLTYTVLVEQTVALSNFRKVLLLGLFGAVAIAGHIILLNYFCCKKRLRLRLRAGESAAKSTHADAEATVSHRSATQAHTTWHRYFYLKDALRHTSETHQLLTWLGVSQ